MKASGLSPLSLHGLRHTWATLALKAGVHLKVVQERLGHSSIAVTMNVFRHVLAEIDSSPAETVAALFTPPRETSQNARLIMVDGNGLKARNRPPRAGFRI